jgi:glycerol-3-phosphate acyltransferase PlsY
MITAAISSYLLGSVPTAHILGKWLRRIDIRNVGVRNMGALNAYRVLGPFWGVVTFFVDASKGGVAVLLARANGLGAQAIAFCGLLAVAGHNWPVFARFRGGKGAATGVGVVLALGGEVALWVAVLVSAIYLVSRNISFALGVTFFVLPALYAWEGRVDEALAIGAGLLALIGVKLRSSIKDLQYASQGRVGLVLRYMVRGVPPALVEERRRLAAAAARARALGECPVAGPAAADFAADAPAADFAGADAPAAAAAAEAGASGPVVLAPEPEPVPSPRRRIV